MQLEGQPYILSSELGMKYGAGKLPYAALIDGDGVLRSRGLVNSREHLESLVESMLTGYDSLQDYLVQERGLEQAS
jgi:methylamine dehydrogenase accessory protein MauD